MKELKVENLSPEKNMCDCMAEAFFYFMENKSNWRPHKSKIVIKDYERLINNAQNATR